MIIEKIFLGEKVFLILIILVRDLSVAQMKVRLQLHVNKFQYQNFKYSAYGTVELYVITMDIVTLIRIVFFFFTYV